MQGVFQVPPPSAVIATGFSVYASLEYILFKPAHTFCMEKTVVASKLLYYMYVYMYLNIM